MMPYASVAELRARYAREADYDEFSHHSDAHLGQALAAASQEIDSWRPPGALGALDTPILAEKALTLARMLAHQDGPILDPGHPIVRDGLAVRDWLKALAAGRVRLPGGTDQSGQTIASAGAVATGAPARVYDAAWLEQYQL